jgi:hypothetical protein
MVLCLLGTNAIIGCGKCVAPGVHISVLDKTVYDEDVRRFLPTNHPFRTDPKFGPPETRGPFARRTHDKILQNARVVEGLIGAARDTFVRAIGVKGLSILLELEFFNIEFASLDAMHILANAGERVSRIVIGENDTLKVREDMNATGFLGRDNWIERRQVDPGRRKQGGGRRVGQKAKKSQDESPEEEIVFPPHLTWHKEASSSSL